MMKCRPKPFDPVAGRAQEVHLLLVFLLRRLALLGGQVTGVLGRAGLVEMDGVIAAVKGDVGLDKEVVGKQAASVPQQDFQHVVGLPAPAPIRHAFLQNGGQAKAGRQQNEQNQKRTNFFTSSRACGGTPARLPTGTPPCKATA